MITFNKIVSKLLKKWWKVIFKDDIFEIIDPEKKSKYITFVNKVIYRLKSEDIIKTIRNGVYIIPDRFDENLNEIDLIEKYYFIFIKKYINKNVGNEYFISGKKSLEIHLKNFSIPDKLIIINRKFNKKVFLWNYQIVFKTISNRKINLYQKFSLLTKNIIIEWVNFKISSIELAVVETAIIWDNNEWIDINLISKTIKKYWQFFQIENFYYIGELKYIIAFNRLKEISKHIDKKLHWVFLDIIKKNWGLFIWEWLRKII